MTLTDDSNPPQPLATEALTEPPTPDLRPSRHVVVSGYYGFDNLGDDLILQTLVQQLRQVPEYQFDIAVLSNQPEKTAKQFGVTGIDRKSFVDITDALAYAHLFISGGGGLFQDVTGPASPLYYGGLIGLAKYFKVPTFFWSQGVGPLKTPIGRWMTQWALNQCDGITVRDVASTRLVERLTGSLPEMTADPVWLLDPQQYPSKKKNTDFWTIGISLRPWRDLTEARMKALVSFFERMAENSYKPLRFMLFPFQESTDFALLQRFKDLMNQGKLANSCHWVSQSDLLPAIGECDVFFGMRYHSLLLALLYEVPIYGLIYDPKVEQLIDQFQLQGTSVSRLEYLDDGVVRVYLKGYQMPDLSEMKAHAKRNIDRLIELLESADDDSGFMRD